MKSVVTDQDERYCVIISCFAKFSLFAFAITECVLALKEDTRIVNYVPVTPLWVKAKAKKFDSQRWETLKVIHRKRRKAMQSFDFSLAVKGLLAEG